MNRKQILLPAILILYSHMLLAQKQFQKDIPTLKNGLHPHYYLNKPEIEKMLGLHTLENGYDSIQIRLWYTYGRSDSGQLVILSNPNHIWSAMLINFIYLTHGNGKIDSIRQIRSTPAPSVGWIEFTKQIFDNSITTLPDQYQIKNYPEYSDGDEVVVEIATKDKYRIFAYSEPHLAQSNSLPAARIEKIINIISQQLHFRQFKRI